MPVQNSNVVTDDPNEWTILQVENFIKNLTNDTDAEPFIKSEIDGKALLLLEKEDLLQYMKINVGPALKILEEIKQFRKRK